MIEVIICLPVGVLLTYQYDVQGAMSLGLHQIDADGRELISVVCCQAC